ncbi:MAG: nucleotidyltransferase family protein [Clostridiales Family XIII bacterium]|jgi:predicted nucleotidyltransferase|nr:nucleotidyltransferase family protein [Clostridiales Family XIII bacterium]
MSGTLGIIAEYDPFHNGHAHCLAEAKRLSGCGRVVCVMSGQFVQRGDPAQFDKYLRAEAAVRNGADLVLELPFAYSATGAENFARGGVRLLAGMHMVDAIAFGSESPSIEPMKALARELAFESDELSAQIQRNLGEGLSYPASRHAAVKEVFGEEAAALIEKPNDILGIEYLKQLALLETESMGTRLICFRPVGPVDDPTGIAVYPIPRKGPGETEGPQMQTSAYGQASPVRETLFSGAAAIRHMLRDGKLGRAFAYMPETTADLIRNLIHQFLPYVSVWDMRVDHAFEMDFSRVGTRVGGMVFPEALFSPFQHALITMGQKGASELYSVSEGIENRMFEAAMQAQNYGELVAQIKSKRYTETRVRRLILHAALHVTKQEMERALSERLCARVLAFGPSGAEILREIKEKDPSVVLYQNLRLQEDELSRSSALLGLSTRADMIYYMLQGGSLAGFRYSPEPVRI